MTNPLWESFSWLTPEAFKFEEVGKGKVRIKGIALKSETVSRNARHYIDEELVKSARTLVGKPININHDDKRIVGNVEWAEYEEGLLEYYGVVSKEPYVRLIKEKDPSVRGVSVQAKYLHNTCAKCGMKFYSDQDYSNHMHSVEKVKEVRVEPHGIIYDALALVISPEEPGVVGTTIQAMETLKTKVIDGLMHGPQYGMSQLLETVTKTYEEKERMTETEKLAKAAVSVQPEKTIAAGPTGISVGNLANIQVLTNPKAASDNITISSPKIVAEKVHLTDQQVQEIAGKFKEAEYPWDQCVSDRQADGYDEDSAKRICAAIKNRTISHTADKPLKEWGPGCKFSRNRRARETLKPTERDFDFKEMSQHHGPKYAAEKFEQMKEDYDYKTRMNEKVAAMETDMDEIESNMEAETKKAVEFLRTDIKEHLDQHPKDDLGWKDEIKAIKESIPKDDLAWKEEIVKLTEIITAQKENSDKIVNALNEEYKKFKATSEEQIQKLTQEKATLENKVTETTKKLEETVTNVDNLKDKQKGTFKGKPSQEKSGGTSYTDPLTGR